MHGGCWLCFTSDCSAVLDNVPDFQRVCGEFAHFFFFYFFFLGGLAFLGFLLRFGWVWAFASLVRCGAFMRGWNGLGWVYGCIYLRVVP